MSEPQTAASGISDYVIARCADDLFTAERTRHPIPALTAAHPALSVQDAYRIQRTNVDRRLEGGESIVGHKVGLTSKAMQELFHVNEPDFGHLMNTMMFTEQDPLDLGTLVDPQVEVEPAFRLRTRLEGPDVTPEEVLKATDYITMCLEIIDSRIIGWKIKLQDTVADNGSSARVIMGTQKVSPQGLALDNLHTELEVDGDVVETGNTGAILGHPANGIAWLARKLSEFGLALDAGSVVLPGTCTRSYRIGGHGTVTGRIAGIGSVSVRLAGKPAVANPGKK